MEFTALIPARMASTRLPGKPLADIAGLPMVVRVAQRAQASGAQRVAVACDDTRIASAVRAHGFQAVMTRADCANGTERLAEAAEHLGLDAAHIVVNVQGDEPLIEPAHVARCAQALHAAPHCAIATAAHRITSVDEFFNPNVVKLTRTLAGEALSFSRAPLPWARDAFASLQRGLPEHLPEGLPALRHVGLYAYRVSFLQAYRRLAPTPCEQAEQLEQLRALEHGYRIAVVELDAAPPAGVDMPADLERVRAWFAAHGA